MLTLNFNSINFCAGNYVTKKDVKQDSYTYPTLKIEAKDPEHENLYIFTLSPKSKKLISALNHQIGITWGEIKKGYSINSQPKFTLIDDKKYIEVKPIYGSNRSLLSIELTDKNYTEKILIDRKQPDNFRYEKSIVTDFGYATLKSFNSEVQHDIDMTKYVNTQIENYFPKILSQNLLEEYFGRQSLTRRNGIIIDI